MTFSKGKSEAAHCQYPNRTSLHNNVKRKRKEVCPLSWMFSKTPLAVPEESPNRLTEAGALSVHCRMQMGTRGFLPHFSAYVPGRVLGHLLNP